MTRLKDKYISEVAPALQEKFKAQLTYADPEGRQDRSQHGCW